MARTYIPALRLVTKAVHRYATRWQTELQGSLTEVQYECLLALIEAAVECLNALGEAPIEP